MSACVLSHSSHEATLWTLSDPVDCSLPGSSVHGILQARILKWVAMPSPGDLPDPGIEPETPVAPALQADSLPLSHQGSPDTTYQTSIVTFVSRRDKKTSNTFLIYGLLIEGLPLVGSHACFTNLFLLKYFRSRKGRLEWKLLKFQF